jgi:hypothetical protein
MVYKFFFAFDKLCRLEFVILDFTGVKKFSNIYCHYWDETWYKKYYILHLHKHN